MDVSELHSLVELLSLDIELPTYNQQSLITTIPTSLGILEVLSHNLHNMYPMCKFPWGGNWLGQMEKLDKTLVCKVICLVRNKLIMSSCHQLGKYRLQFHTQPLLLFMHYWGNYKRKMTMQLSIGPSNITAQNTSPYEYLWKQ